MKLDILTEQKKRKIKQICNNYDTINPMHCHTECYIGHDPVYYINYMSL